MYESHIVAAPLGASRAAVGSLPRISQSKLNMSGAESQRLEDGQEIGLDVPAIIAANIFGHEEGETDLLGKEAELQPEKAVEQD